MLRIAILILISASVHTAILIAPQFGQGGGIFAPNAKARPAPARAGLSVVFLDRVEAKIAKDAPPSHPKEPSSASPTPEAVASTPPKPVTVVEQAEVASVPIADADNGVSIKGEGVLPIAGRSFFATRELSRPPQPLRSVDLEPAGSGWSAFAGRIVLTLWISEHGNVVETKTESSDLPENVKQFVVNAFARAQFAPGERSGRAVGSVLRVEVKYDEVPAELPRLPHR
jgi:protein TonB